MKSDEVRKMTAEELDVEIVRLRRKLYDLRCQTVTEKIEDSSMFAKVRKDVARMLTERTARTSRKAAAPAGRTRTKTKTAASARTTTRKAKA
jgi:large subunit ribosomal protein L29